jgi:hypothetical protein
VDILPRGKEKKMVKRDRTGEPIDELDNEEQADILIELGQEEVKKIRKLESEYLKKITADLKPTKSGKKLKEIRERLALWRHIEAFFVARQIQEEKDDVVITETFSDYGVVAAVSFTEYLKSSSTIGEAETKAKFKQEVFNELVREW